MPDTAPYALRSITPEDFEFLLGVYASTREEELAQVAWGAGQKDAFLRMQFEAQSQYYREHYKNADLSVILVGQEPAGRLYLHRRRTEIRLMDIALLPGFRGRGVGTAILNALFGEAEREGKRVTIHVESFNPAMRLYERLGFERLEERGVYWFLEWRPKAGPHGSRRDLIALSPV